jgi:general secretion pathway protein K
MRRRGHLRDGEGYVTVAVLVVAAILAALAAATLSVSRPAAALARIGADRVVADALAEGALAWAAHRLFDGEGDPAPLDGSVLRRDTGSARITLADESGRVDLNGADPRLLAGLYRAVGGTSLAPTEFAARVADWRDADGEPSAGGAEAADYAEAGLSGLPPDSRFQTVDELRFLLGLSGEDFARLRPFLTVAVGDGLIDLFAALPAVLQALPDLSAAERDGLLALRRTSDRAAARAELEGRFEFLRGSPSGVYRILVDVRLENGFSAAIESVIKRGAGDGGSPVVVAWSRRVAAAPPAE